jgi:hypothetical protein
MSEKIEKLSEEKLEGVSGGMTAELKAAYACIRGEYGNGQDRVLALRRAGYDPNVVQGLVNSLCAGYDKVAIDVMNGKYGNGQARINALQAAGYDAYAVQNLVNHIMWN